MAPCTSLRRAAGRFVVSPNAPVRQIWISALSTSFKLDWSESANEFVLSKTGEAIKPLVARLINEQMGGGEVEMRTNRGFSRSTRIEKA